MNDDTTTNAGSSDGSSDRTAQHALLVRCGSEAGASMKLKAPQAIEVGRVGRHIVDLAIPAFAWAAIMITGERSEGRKLRRMLILEPAPDVEPFTFEYKSFFVRGRFRVVERINNHERAAEAWKLFQPR